MFATTQLMGFDMGFPDVCKTPAPAAPVPVPVPYPNGSYEVKNSATKLTRKSNISGNEAGTLAGVVSSVTMGKLVGNAALLKYLVDKAQAKGYKVMINVKNTGKAAITLQGTSQQADSNRSSTTSNAPHIRGAYRMYMARSGTEGMEWLLRRLD